MTLTLRERSESDINKEEIEIHVKQYLISVRLQYSKVEFQTLNIAFINS